MALFVIDFDNTMVKGHTHNTIANAIRAKTIRNDDEEAQWALVRGFTALGGAGRWRTLLRSLLENGHQVSIASFNSYKHVIPRFLREVVGLNEDEINRIHVNAWLPDDPRNSNKNEHIEQVIMHYYPDARPKSDQVILIDDSLNNIVSAQLAEYQVVYAKPDCLFLARLEELSNELKVEQSHTAASTFKR